MSLKPLEEIGAEIHESVDQFFRIEKGDGKVVINEIDYLVSDGDAVIIPMGSKHNILNTSDKNDLKIYTIYSPPHHKDGLVNPSKVDAETKDIDFDGITTE